MSLNFVILYPQFLIIEVEFSCFNYFEYFPIIKLVVNYDNLFVVDGGLYCRCWRFHPMQLDCLVRIDGFRMATAMKGRLA
ncbi:hypothetical protein PHAMO_380076 [Magnetospirillum molischianum DSM 120]|uniref:Uncharacterized protein n=1 Tax=Magnetospirillum molischianum DSM 120 TaxID=1150626 RepID=H8FVM0_MAGML|nr:hypothetical protein PHAMO_380076 [Magnetospirillum molischianum DSM 120]